MKAEHSLRILIAEDDSVIVLMLKEMLKRMGHKVIDSARNGREAVEKTKFLKPDLIIMDIKMPEMDGIEASRMIKDEMPTPIVILTAYSDESLIEEASEERIFSYLVKPVSENDLRPALKLAVDRFKEWEKMDDELKIAQESIESRKKIDQAKWVLVDQIGCTEAEAYQLIRHLSRDHNIKMGVVAQLLTAILDVLQRKKGETGD